MNKRDDMEEIKKPVIRFEYKCLRCGETWIGRDARLDPKTCAICRSPNWNKPRKKKKV